MPNIVINEIDLTTPGGAAESTDVVYIPGFVDSTQKSLYKTTNGVTTYVGLTYNSPQLFTSVAQFISLCGKSAPKFKTKQTYPSKFSADAIAGLDKTEIGNSTIMFEEGVADPGYVMAKELLSAGISVMFERVDDREAIYAALASEVANTLIDKSADSLSKYYYKDANDKYISYSIPVYKNNSLYKISMTQPLSELKLETFSTDKNSYYILSNGVYVALKNIEGADAPTTQEGLEEILKKADTESTGVVVGFEPAKTTDNEGNEVNKTTITYEELQANPNTYYSAGSNETYGAVTVEKDFKYKTYESNNIHECKLVPTVSVAAMYNALAKIYDTSNVSGIVDRGNYSIKYLTSGGYPVYEYDGNSLVTSMLAMAEKRGDCVALIDHTDNVNRSIDPYANGSVYKQLQTDKDSFDNGDFGTMFTPWATYNRVTSDTCITKKSNGDEVEKVEKNAFRAPGSFAYLAALADSIKTNANWLAIAGAARGGVKNLASGGMTTVIPNGVADAMQPRTNAVALNAITNINPYGLTIWGNRTLKPVEENLVATSFLNVRNLISDIKKTCYSTAREATFEQDTDILWINFKSSIATLLDRMKSGYGISGYKIVRDNDHEMASTNATLCAKIIIYPTYAVEDFYITVVLQDDEVSVN